jgi:formate C-acetyltransferase
MQYEDCIREGLTPKEGGARYPEGRTSWLGSRGMVDIADSLAAIKKLVFDKKTVTMDHSSMPARKTGRVMSSFIRCVLSAPKYGNDDDYVDEIYDMLSTKVPEIMQRWIDPITGKSRFVYRRSRRPYINRSCGRRPAQRKDGRLAG